MQLEDEEHKPEVCAPPRSVTCVPVCQVFDRLEAGKHFPYLRYHIKRNAIAQRKNFSHMARTFGFLCAASRSVPQTRACGAGREAGGQKSEISQSQVRRGLHDIIELLMLAPCRRR
jgi:hypothetical protein